ncbi:histidine kinase [Sphaerisporangium melleum]|uniref:histidine kinase n=1 Tax=Sphaerisporangium melleum TaxID=321316 RepID=A0A917RC75_9ACTN|nr:histidine kinase [Sphaerisporangium melleum]GGL01168.1 histidine kinase [Sphaerisporangium melleum]GII71655.1 histidine kinase [Sphaerisporangium melleum]
MPLKTTLVGLGRSLVLSALAAVNAVLFAMAALVLLLCFGFGMIFLFPAGVRLIRRRATHARRLALAWADVQIIPPYRPPPPPPMPQRDGWYREGRSLYRTSMVPNFNRTFAWMLKDPATWRDLAWLLAETLAGVLLVAPPPLLVVLGLALVPQGPLYAVIGLALASAGLLLAPRMVRLHGLWTRWLLAPTPNARLTNAIRRLEQVHTEAVDTQAAELRRIERDLHDGAQARLVAIGMTLAAAEELIDSDPRAAKALIVKVREASAASLIELRQLVRGIHPPVLAERGLRDAVRALALDSPLEVSVNVELPVRPEAPVESAAYFVVSELLANAGRHGNARHVTVDISRRGVALRITVIDDGQGGADPSRGSGLRGIERRVAAFDGVLALHSPEGGPTTASVDIPRAFAGQGACGAVVPRWKYRLLALLLGLCWLPMFPQGLVAMALKIFQVDERSWFLALYLPEPFQWPMMGTMVLLGSAMTYYAYRLSIEIRQAEAGVTV